MSFIELKQLDKKYNLGKKSEVHALKGIDLEVEKSDLIAVVGRSGSGKSTLLHILGCIDKPTEGEYILDGIKIHEKRANELAVYRNEKIGFVLQEYGLIQEQKVIDNVSIPLLFGRESFHNIKTKALDILELLNIKDLASKRVGELSGGQKQRVAIARALVNNPDLILADEPTGALDTRTASEIMDILVDLNSNGKCIIIVTHDMQIASRCKTIINISDGELC